MKNLYGEELTEERTEEYIELLERRCNSLETAVDKSLQLIIRFGRWFQEGDEIKKLLLDAIEAYDKKLEEIK